MGALNFVFQPSTVCVASPQSHPSIVHLEKRAIDPRMKRIFLLQNLTLNFRAQRPTSLRFSEIHVNVKPYFLIAVTSTVKNDSSIVNGASKCNEEKLDSSYSIVFSFEIHPLTRLDFSNSASSFFLHNFQDSIRQSIYLLQGRWAACCSTWSVCRYWENPHAFLFQEMTEPASKEIGKLKCNFPLNVFNK